jgi:hypothetical protein
LRVSQPAWLLSLRPCRILRPSMYYFVCVKIVRQSSWIFSYQFLLLMSDR